MCAHVCMHVPSMQPHAACALCILGKLEIGETEEAAVADVVELTKVHKFE